MIFSEPIPSFIADLCSSLSTSKRSRFKNKSNYAKSESSYKGRFSFTSEVTVMGQNQGKGPINVGEFTGPSNLFQPDQHGYHFHPAPPEPTYSAPFALKDDQSDPFSRGDCTPGGTLSKSKGSISRPRNLAKKLSQRSKGSHGPSKSVGAKMQAFEEMVKDAELRAGFDVISPNSQPSITSQPAIRSTASNDFFGPKTASSTETSALHQTLPLAATTALTRPGHHRRMSSTSLKSARISIKSSKRAEREWRARVAALAHAPSPHSNRAELRGPVPPKRTPASARYVYPVDSPPSEAIITPAPSDQTNDDTPAKSSISNMSFETLGHYHQPPIKADLIYSDPSVRDRRASVPRSVISSFYFDPAPGSRISTRPSSLAVTQVLSTVPAGPSSPLRPSSVDEVSNEPKATPITPKSHKLSLPPFKSFQLAPGSVNSKPPSSPALPESNVKPNLHVRRDKHVSDPPQLGPISGSAQSDLQVTINGELETHYHTSSIGCSQRSVRIEPALKSQLHTTPRRAHQISIPGTPLSPTTAYLMSAPIDALDLSKLTGMESPEQKGHPFSLVPVDVNPSPQVKRSLVVDGTQLKTQPQYTEPLSTLPSTGDTSSDPFLAETKLKKKEVTIKDKRPKQFQKDYSQSRILQTRKTQPKMVALGGDPARVELERQREKLRKMGIDLTPGMESRNRPPKSGMQMNASQRFLGQELR